MARFQHLMCAFGLSAGLSLVTGCPSPPDAGDGKDGNQAAGPRGKGPGEAGARSGSGPGKGGQNAQGGPGGGEPHGGPAVGAGPDGGPGHKPGPGDPGGLNVPAPPSFADLIGDGDSITISVTVVGADHTQIDFQTMIENDGHVLPRVIHVEQVEGAGPHEIKAPAVFDDDVYVSVLVVGDDEANSGGAKDGMLDRAGGLAEPIKLAGANHSLTVAVGTIPPWLKELTSPHEMLNEPLGGPLGGPGAGEHPGPGPE